MVRVLDLWVSRRVRPATEAARADKPPVAPQAARGTPQPNPKPKVDRPRRTITVVTIMLPAVSSSPHLMGRPKVQEAGHAHRGGR